MSHVVRAWLGPRLTPAQRGALALGALRYVTAPMRWACAPCRALYVPLRGTLDDRRMCPDCGASCVIDPGDAPPRPDHQQCS